VSLPLCGSNYRALNRNRVPDRALSVFAPFTANLGSDIFGSADIYQACITTMQDFPLAPRLCTTAANY
jgi:hypothetical protein